MFFPHPQGRGKILWSTVSLRSGSYLRTSFLASGAFDYHLLYFPFGGHGDEPLFTRPSALGALYSLCGCPIDAEPIETCHIARDAWPRTL